MGDEFQDLAAWAAAVQLIVPGPKYQSVQMEMNGLGNLDDVVLRTKDPDQAGDLFQQLKWTTRESNFLDEEYMTSVPSSGTRSLLNKLYSSYVGLRDRAGQAHFQMQLLSNRPADPAHPLLSQIDGRTGMLVPFAMDQPSGSSAGKALTTWAEHLQVERDGLLEMLSKLRFRAGRDLAGERENAKALMLAAGLARTDVALDNGIRAAGAWVRDGRREATETDVLAVVEAFGLSAQPPTATVLVEDIDHDRSPEAATVNVNWVSHYAETDPALRRVRTDPAMYEHAAADIRGAADTIEAEGYRRVHIRGHFRQATAFLVGNSFPKTRGFDLEYKQGPTWWATDAARQAPHIQEHPTAIGQGDDLAVLVATAATATDDVLRYLKDQQAPVSELRTYIPDEGEHDTSVLGPGHAVGIASEIRQRVRAALAAAGGTDRRVHLFVAGPNGLAVFLGHRWNAVTTTIVYEHRGVGAGYVPSFVVQA
ncbi:SAVED domain-containing protein [Nocardioides mangrovicus]|uniref:SAVED domain-containing protein n=1 Tax=Nocardioides mangrovicus TaxID=2478913 RepID=A0A3L8P3W9_9ACTN|nr:SAVED domain-containing protein [Nocardioides mangrovicus]RLV49727.1 SAVED domain-containing protein [Nocardioides mangrovicus]